LPTPLRNNCFGAVDLSGILLLCGQEASPAFRLVALVQGRSSSRKNLCGVLSTPTGFQGGDILPLLPASEQALKTAAMNSERDKKELRTKLATQLNLFLDTRDSARGLIVNMSDVLFDSGQFSLKAGAREKLAKISGIVLAYPTLKLEVEGYTDSVGSDDLNMKLSENRAGSVRDFLVQEGIGTSSISSRGFGKSQPVATNDTTAGRQQNRRVELIVSGDVIRTMAH
jgi:outer membrane protein OmpA-like peptidoglycan-associated protein